MPDNRKGVNSLDPPVGLIRKGSIVGYDPSSNQLQVQLTGSQSISGKPLPVTIPHSFPLSDSLGLFVGSLPSKNTTVTVAQSAGGQYHLVGYSPENLANIPTMRLGELLLHSTDTAEITLDSDSNIYIGSEINNIHIFAGSQKYPKGNLVTLNFENENHFTQAYREVGGLVKRDLRPNQQAASYSGDTKLESDSYDSLFSLVGMDPTATANDIRVGPTKNPPLVEHREMVYEFQYSSKIDDDVTESNKYTTTTQANNIYATPNRRSSRADTMSLTLKAPNFLIEQVKGTVVDIFGNILDINRNAIPVGLSANNTLRTSGTVATTNAQQSYLNIRALERKSIAYHFEINARKDPTVTFPGVDLSINGDNYNAKLLRSRFSFDVDKEGQFKLNVPASSEVGNVPLLLRAENYSTFATTDNNNPNQTWFTQSANNTSQDIYVDSFAAPMSTPSSSAAGYDVTTINGSIQRGSIQLLDDKNADQGPPDRIAQFVNNNSVNIRHGTAHHDILQACGTLRLSDQTLGYPTGAVDNVDLSYVSSDKPTNAAVASNKITVAGTNANAGGRSGSINMDGSLEVNLGANTVDRQSLWLDTAGGAVVMLGRDTNQRSLVMGMDGHAFIQIGGYGLTEDARKFGSPPTTQDNSLLDGILDIRIMNGSFTHMIRVDNQGIVIMTPGRLGIHAGQGMTLSSDGNIEIDCESLIMQGRLHKKIFGGSS